MLITDGDCQITVNGTTSHAGWGNAALIDCYSPHQYESETGWKSLWIHFDGPLARAYYEQITANFGTVFLHSNFHGIYHMLEKIYQDFANGIPVNEPQISTRITAILNDILNSKESPDISPSLLKETIAYINEHFCEKIHLQDLAAMTSLSPFYFTRVFTKETGMTPYQYLLSARLSFSKLLLKSSDFSVKEIAFRSGFSDEGHFCSCFKKHEHMTPSQYRNK